MNVVILHEPVPADAPPDAADVLVQAAAIGRALAAAGHRATTVAFAPAEPDWIDRLTGLCPDVVFNLVETIDGSCRGAEAAPALLERLGIPYTGCGPTAMREATDKLRSKQILLANDLPTPLHLSWEALQQDRAVPAARYIVKSVWEHGSVGLETDCVLAADCTSMLRDALAARLPRFGGTGFAETYVPGREFNLALLETADGKDVECLPPAEIAFAHAESDGPRLVGYRAKWASGSAEDLDTPRCFDFAERDAALLRRVTELARAVWRAFGLRGYARVDLRVDEHDEPFVIDVNTNPCLSPDAGFAAAVAQAGIGYPQLVDRLLAAARSHQGPRDTLRTELRDGDETLVREIVDSTGFFHAEEVDIAVELVAERRAKGDASGYHFVFLERGGKTLGYACFGPIPATRSSYDLYWIAVHKDAQRLGLGLVLMQASERAIAARGGTRIYVDTSSRPSYAPTRAFYERAGYTLAADLTDFYAPGDGKSIYCKVVG